MYALHWICALTLALVSCLCAQPVKRNELLGYISDLNTTVIKAECPDDIRLYSPFDITKDCMSSALNCTIKGLNVLNYECSIPKDDFEAIENVIIGLREQQITLTSSSTDCKCEKYDQKDVKQFLHNMKRQVQQLNSM